MSVYNVLIRGKWQSNPLILNLTYYYSGVLNDKVYYLHLKIKLYSELRSEFSGFLFKRIFIKPEVELYLLQISLSKWTTLLDILFNIHILRNLVYSRFILQVTSTDEGRSLADTPGKNYKHKFYSETISD